MSTQGGAQQRYGCYIGNIDTTVSLDMLKQVFSSCGTIVDASLNGRTTDAYRFGFIDFATDEARAKALKYNGFTLVGRKLRVGVSKGNVGKPEGFGNPSPRENQMPHQHQPQPQPSSFPGAAATTGNGLSAAEQQQAQFLLQLIQQGSVDPQTLTEAQRTLLVAALSGGSTGNAEPAASAPAAAPAAPVVASAPQMPPMGMYNPMWGAMPGQFGGVNPFGAPMMAPGMMMGMYGQQQMQGGYQRPPRGAAANPPPSEELQKLRDIQRKQFLKVVTKQTEDYEAKLKEREGKADEKSGEDSSESDGDNGPEDKKAKPEISDPDEKSS